MNVLPPGVTEAEALRVIEHVADILGPQFALGPNDLEDIRQDIALEAWKVLTSGKFDPAKGTLEQLAFVHCRNRCLNRSRDRRARPLADAPCQECRRHVFDNGPAPHNGELCDRWKQWADRQARKMALASAYAAEPSVQATKEDSSLPVDEQAGFADLQRLIDEKLPVELRRAYLQMRAGVTYVDHHMRQRVREAIADILDDAGLPVPDVA